MKSLAPLILTSALALGACAGSGGTPAAESKPAESEPKPAEPAPAAAVAAPTPAPDPLAEARASYHPALLDPSRAQEQAPETYTVKFETDEGDILIDVTRAWAPNGADRFYNLVKIGYYDDVAFFRVIEGFMAQLGIHTDPQVNQVWRVAKIGDDPVQGSNTQGMVTFAMGGPNSRTTQIFLNLVDNSRLDKMGFAPFGKVRSMDVVKKLHSGYGEGAPRGSGPNQMIIQQRGNKYLEASFPELDYVRRASVVE